MSYKADVAKTGRDFFSSPAGDNNQSGLSGENDISSLNLCIDRINVLSPVPSPNFPASLNASVTGTYVENLILPDWVSVNCTFASLINNTPGGVSVKGGSFQTSQWGALINLAEDGLIYEVDGKMRHRASINAVVGRGLNGVGFDVKGVCDDIFFDAVEAEMHGENYILINHTATSETPIQYEFKVSEFFAENQTFMIHDPAGFSAETIVKGGAIQLGTGATAMSTAGSKIFDVKSGILVVDYDVLQAEVVAAVSTGSTLSLDARVIAGDINAETDSVVLAPTAGAVIGDTSAETGGILLMRALDRIGDTQIGAGSGGSLEAVTVTGDVNVDGEAFLFINTLIGALTGTGVKNGWVDGTPYGKYEEQLILKGSDFTAQNPLGLDTPLQILFGGVQASTGGEVSLAADGSLTANVRHRYNIGLVLQYGRAGAGGVSWLFFRTLVNSIPVGNTILKKIDNANDDTPAQFTNRLFLDVGDVLTVELVRDSQGNNTGGLVVENPTLVDWAMSPSASMSVSI
jgi:hypothetical protein